MKIKPSGSASQQRTRRAIMQWLKEQGPMDAKSIAEHFGTTTMAVRLHLYALAEEKLIDCQEEPRPLGRPAKIWRLRPEANRFFHNAHAELAVGLIRSMGQAFGSEGMEQLLSIRAKEQVVDYRRKLSANASLRERVKVLAEIRSEEGYMAEVKEGEDQSMLLVENHCPICDAAASCLRLCDMELEVFQKTLGPEVNVKRIEHIQAGARRCAYSIKRPSTQSTPPGGS